MIAHGFRRNTHHPDGSFREEMQGLDPGPDAGFLVHMLDPREPVTRETLRVLVAQYDGCFPDTEPACSDVNEALLVLLECGAVVVEPMPR